VKAPVLLLAAASAAGLLLRAGVVHSQEPAGAPATAPAPAEFAACAVCHSTDGSEGTGPTLKGVAGRTAGTVAGFRYSRAMRQAGITWDAVTLGRYLADPQATVPGNVMPFAGVEAAESRARIVAYLVALR
jgi:cytochrome c